MDKLLLFSSFRAGLPPALQALDDVPGLENALVDMVSSAHAACPDVNVDDGAFVRYVAARITGKSVSTDVIRQLNAADLYLACAVVERAPEALRQVQSRCFPVVHAALARMGLSADQIEDLQQELRKRLLLGDAEAPPRIVLYAGQGDLSAWIRVAAVRDGLKVISHSRRETASDDDSILEAGASSGDPELAYVKEVYRPKFKAAFQAALDSLTDRQRTLLRQHIVDGLTVDELGALYHVHRASAARWVAKAKDDLLARTRKLFAAQAKVGKDECESILRQVQSQLDGTIRRRLAEIEGESR